MHTDGLPPGTFELEEEPSERYPDPQDIWKYLAAPYVLRALQSGEPRLCERCESLHLEEHFVKRVYEPSRKQREGFRERTGQNNAFDFEIDTAVMNSSCPLCNILRSLTVGTRHLSFRDVYLPTRAHGKLLLEKIESNGSKFRMNQYQIKDFTGPQLLAVPWPKNPEDVDWTFLKECMSLCRKEHRSTCFPVQHLPVKGFRLHNCKTNRLENSPVDATYAALSYVWGNTTTKSWPPKTIEDAKIVATELGYTYLWADQLCIGQDSSHKMSQIQQMDSIYQNADLTIIAAAGGTSDHGIPGISGPSRPVQKFARFGDHVILESRGEVGLHHLTRSSKWKTRAWTFQEEILSRRRLYFSGNMAWFACSAGEGWEEALEATCNWEREDLLQNVGCPGSYFVHQITDNMSPEERDGEFQSLLSEYTSRQLTDPGDILNAFSGILRKFETINLPLNHLFGVPIDIPYRRPCSSSNVLIAQPRTSEGLIRGLKWNRGSRDMEWTQHGTWDSSLRRRRGFPSWSWTGWETKVEYGSGVFEDPGDVETGITVGVELKDGSILPWPQFQQELYLKESPAKISPFIHLDVWTTTVTVSPSHGILKGYDLRFHPSDAVLDIPIGPEIFEWKWKGVPSRVYTGLLLFPLDSTGMDTMLLVEEKDQWAERVGSLLFRAPNASLLKLERRQIRLG